MPNPIPYSPAAVFSSEESDRPSVPRVLIAPYRYIQGDGILDHLGRYLSIVPSKHAAILISDGGRRRFGDRLTKSFSSAGVEAQFVTFNGECSLEEINRVVQILNTQGTPVDSLVAVGGGKCVDAGKSIAFRLGIPAVVCPSLASNDAPCSALSVLYTPQGVFDGAEFFPVSPAIVAVDTRVVAEAPARYLVSGMGDAMATWYEARTCLHNPKARNTVGARPTLAAGAIGELCAKTLFEYGAAGADAVKRSEVNDALESVIEANTLLSGLGFESGGLAAAHAVAQGFTVIPEAHHSHLHGEMVAIGLLTQLILEKDADEAKKVAGFFAEVGLPAHLGQLSIATPDKAQLGKVMDAAFTQSIVHNEPFDVTKQTLLDALLQAHELGTDVVQSMGDAAYSELHSG